MARAGMFIRAASANNSVSRAAPSSIEYSVCTCRCTNCSTVSAATLVPAPLTSVLVPVVGRHRSILTLGYDDTLRLAPRVSRPQREGDRGSPFDPHRRPHRGPVRQEL